MNETMWNLMQTLSPALSSQLVLRRLTRPPRRKARPWEEDALEGATPAEVGDRHFGWSWGDPEKPRVLLVHGFGGQASQMGVLAQACASAGMHALAFDGPAHGASPEDETDPFSFAESLLEMGREWGPFEAVVGHSFGGGCVVLAALQGLPSKRFVFLAAPSHPRAYVEHGRMRPTTRRHVYAAFARRYGTATRFEDEDIARLDRPSLIIHDEDDRWVPYLEGQRLARLLPRAQLETLSGVGHFRMLKDPKIAERVAEFASPSTPPMSS